MALFGSGLNVHWVWLPLVITLEVIFAIGMGLAFAAVNVYVRDTRYVVESVNVVLFWMVPITYSWERIKPEYHFIYHFNPVAAVVIAFRKILVENQAPATSTILNLTLVSMLALFVGALVFERLKKRFYDYL